MANIKSAKKRIKISEKKYDHNKSIRSAVKTSIKKTEAAVASGNKEAAQASLRETTSQIAKAESKGIYKKNNAARKVSHLAKQVNAME